MKKNKMNMKKNKMKTKNRLEADTDTEFASVEGSNCNDVKAMRWKRL